MSAFGLRPGVRRLLRLAIHSRRASHAEIDEELDALIAARIDALIAHGVPPEAAHAETLRRLGNSLDVVRDQLHSSAEIRERRMSIREYLSDLAQDIRYAARGLAHRPAFTAVAVLTLAIGIGATTAIFSAVNVLLLRPLPFGDPGALMNVWLAAPAAGARAGNDHMVWSYPKATAFLKDQQLFTNTALYSWQTMTITSGDVEMIRGESVGATYMRTLGLSPSRGRDFDPSVDAHPGAAPEVILSDALWQRRFNGDPSIVGKIVDLDRVPFTIIGVAPPGFRGLTGQGELFIPLTTRNAESLGEAQSHEFSMVARQKAGLTRAQIDDAVNRAGRRAAEAYADPLSANKPWGATAQPLDDGRVSPLVKRSLLILFAAVALVLLIACVNVANLLIGRASARRREIAVRLAIGAGRARLVRLLLTESGLLALLGGTASVAVAWLGTRALRVVDPSILRGDRGAGIGSVTFTAIHLDWTALAFTLALVVVVGLFFGLAPALHATRASLSEAMKDGSAGSDRGRGAAAGRRLLVVVEVALAVVLLAGSGLMLRSLGNLLAVDPGYDARSVLTVRLTVPPGGLARDSLPGFYTQLLERVAAVPGVTSVGLGACPPLNGGCNKTLIEFKDRPPVDQMNAPLVGIAWATPGWFLAGHVPLKRGRMFTDADRAGAPRVLLVNETAARTFWPNENPIGKHIAVGQGGYTDAEVIGIVGDVRQSPDSAAMPDVYASYLQSPRPGMMIFIRTAGEPDAAGPDVRRALREIAPKYPVYDMQSLEQRTAAATAPSRFSAVLLGLFAVTALSLAIVGIYGVMSLAVAARTREIGIRIALGASQRRVQRLVVGEGIALVAVGAAFGLVGALASTRVLQRMLFDLTPTDPVTYVSIVVLLAAAAMLASWVPARRASRVDPVEALRAD